MQRTASTRHSNLPKRQPAAKEVASTEAQSPVLDLWVRGLSATECCQKSELSQALGFASSSFLCSHWISWQHRKMDFATKCSPILNANSVSCNFAGVVHELDLLSCSDCA
eukprot:4708730-Amphidinium_carterae.1